jgi:hypothetical protein
MCPLWHAQVRATPRAWPEANLDTASDADALFGATPSFRRLLASKPTSKEKVTKGSKDSKNRKDSRTKETHQTPEAPSRGPRQRREQNSSPEPPHAVPGDGHLPGNKGEVGALLTAEAFRVGEWRGGEALSREVRMDVGMLSVDSRLPHSLRDNRYGETVVRYEGDAQPDVLPSEVSVCELGLGRKLHDSRSIDLAWCW